MTIQARLEDVTQGPCRWAIVEGDCLEVMATLGDKSVDHVITDPPYSEHVHGKARRGAALPDGADNSFGGESSNGACFSRAADLGFASLSEELRTAAAAAFFRLCRRWVLAFSDQESAHPWMTANIAAGLQHIRIGQWVKLNSTPQFTGDRPGTGAEAVVVAHRPGRKRWNGGGLPAVWTHAIAIDRSSTGEQRMHTTQKPVALMLELVSLFTDPGDLVLDPFAGSGTTGVACVRLGRRFIGIEKDARYAAIARERLTAEDRGLNLREARAGQSSIFDVLNP